MALVRAKKAGKRWQGQFKVGCYWFPVKKSNRVSTFASAEAARTAADKARPKPRVSQA